MFFRMVTDDKLAQNAYIIGCQRTGEAIVIDPERDIDRYLDIAKAEGLNIVAAAETHIHADYASGMRELAAHGAKVYVSDEGDADWKYEWAKAGAYDAVFVHDGSSFKVGNIKFDVMKAPGHTPEQVVYMVTDLGGGATEPMGIATGDYIFVGDVGRPDLLESAAGVVGAMDRSARVLYNTLQSFQALPDYLKIWPGHGAGSACGKALGAIPDTTVGYEKKFNASVSFAAKTEQEFVDFILDGQPEPPLYFAHMKKINKVGATVLGGVPQPKAMTADEMAATVNDPNNVVVDARMDRAAFMAKHVKGAIYAPMNKTFNTICGSYITADENIYLVIPENSVDEATRDLIRVGLDNVKGYITPEVLAEYIAKGHPTETIERIDFAAFPEKASAPNTVVLDVRGTVEFQSRHIADAMNIAHTRLRARIAEVPEGKTIIVHCQSGARASGSVSFLARRGWNVIYVDDHVSKAPIA